MSERELVLHSTPEEDLQAKTLEQMPSKLERILDFERLHQSGYEHYGLESIYGKERSRTALRRIHLRCCREWLSFGLEQKIADLILCLTNHPDDEKFEQFRFLQDESSLMALTPSSENSPERELFFADLFALLALIGEAEVCLPSKTRAGSGRDSRSESAIPRAQARHLFRFRAG